MKKNEIYAIANLVDDRVIRKVETERFNILYPSVFRIIKVNKKYGWVRYKYMQYGKFTGLEDGMSVYQFHRLQNTGLLINITGRDVSYWEDFTKRIMTEDEEAVL